MFYQLAEFDFMEWFGTVFTAQNIATLMLGLSTLMSVIALLKKSRNAITGAVRSVKTMDEHTTATVNTSVKKEVANQIAPLFQATKATNENVLDALQLLCKLLVAREDQTPAGKAYFAELTQSIGKTFSDSKEFAEKVSADLKENIAKVKATEEAVSSELDLIAEDEDLPVE